MEYSKRQKFRSKIFAFPIYSRTNDSTLLMSLNKLMVVSFIVFIIAIIKKKEKLGAKIIISSGILAVLLIAVKILML